LRENTLGGFKLAFLSAISLFLQKRRDCFHFQGSSYAAMTFFIFQASDAPHI